jgi:hypothetical protein
MLDTPMGNAGWPRYRKKVLTPALKMRGAFTVETKEGPLSCSDGYLALDAAGWPYPIAREDFERMYEPAASDEEQP